MFGKFNENQPNVATILRQKLLFAGGGSERYALEKRFLLSDSCIFVPDADSCELRVSRHPANAIRRTFFSELTVDSLEEITFLKQEMRPVSLAYPSETLN